MITPPKSLQKENPRKRSGGGRPARYPKGQHLKARVTDRAQLGMTLGVSTNKMTSP